MVDSLGRYWLNLHARARDIDADQALLGALGVAAFAYPHQIYNVRRMVTDTACRWLLADEVGLGKTIQALMVLRALASQRETGLRVALVVPDDLVQHWQEELISRTQVGRAGIAPEPSEEVSPPTPAKGEIAVDLCRQARLASGAIRLNPRLYDVLIVDEYPKLFQAIREMVAVASRTTPHVILLSATPGLHDAQTRTDILSILEPDLARRAQALDRDILELLAERESLAQAVMTGDREADGDLTPPAGEARRYYGTSHAVFRRVIRTRRVDYPDALPQRTYAPIVVPATEGDVRRVTLARQYLAAAITEGQNVRQDLVLQIAGRSPASLINRASTLGRGASSKLLGAVKALDEAARDPGDAKLDALIDHLRHAFSENPKSRILVVAEDNRSVDYLAVAIEKLVEVEVARKRRPYADSETEIDVHVTQLKEDLDAFESGQAKVLVAADVAAEGHNLQFATEIVFYALPWNPAAVDQWIGRLDRLGGKGPPGKRIIRITPIVVQNSIEARILELYEAAEIFSGGRVFDDDAWREMEATINAAAYGSGQDWKKLIADAKRHVVAEEGWRSQSKFQPLERAAAAREQFDALRAQAYPLPFDEDDDHGGRHNWFRSREVAAKRLLTLAQDVGALKLESRVDPETRQRYRTVWYAKKFEDGDIFIKELDVAHPGHKKALIVSRSDILAPPTVNVGSRRLNFFDQGHPLHDAVKAAFCGIAAPNSTATEYVIRFPEGHPGAAYAGRHVVVCSAALRPVFGEAFSDSELTDRTSGGDSTFEREATQTAVRRAFEEHLADNRWFVDLFPPQHYVSAGVHSDGGVKPVSPSLFIGASEDHGLPRLVAERQLSQGDAAVLRTVRDGLRQGMVQQAVSRLQGWMLDAESEAAFRRFKASSEAREAIQAALDSEVRERQRGGRLAIDRARVRAVEFAVLLAELCGEMRLGRLATVKDALRATQLTDMRSLIFKVQ